MIPEISIGEFVLFTVIALIIIKPDDWPRVLRKVGYYYGKFHDFILETRQFTHKTYQDIIVHAEPDGRVTGETMTHGDTDDDLDAHKAAENTSSLRREDTAVVGDDVEPEITEGLN